MVISFMLPQERTYRIQNEFYEVSYFHEAAQFMIKTRTGLAFVKEGDFALPVQQARVVEIVDRIWGAGQAIEVKHTDGSRSIVQLFPKIPFVLFRFVLHNCEKKQKIVRQIKPLSVLVDCRVPAANLRAFGTGGLSTLDKQSGSYMWLAVVEPKSRKGVVAGWTTVERGSGVIFAQEAEQLVHLEAQIDYGNLRLPPHGDAELETFALGYFDDARFGLEAWAEVVAKIYGIRLPPQPVGYCTWYHAGASNEKDLKRLAEFAAKQLKPFGFSVIQIDDGWQDGVKRDGPRRNFSRHRPNGPYPSGMKAIADYVRSLGLTPGLWFMPFAGTQGDPAFKNEWFVRRLNGEPYEVRWGGTCLDMTHPEARDYVRQIVCRIVHEWGYRYLKMDGLWTGTATPLMYVNDGYRDDGIGDAVFYNPTKTHIEAFRDGLKLVRKVAGKGVFLLGCCAPQNMRSYGGAFGLVDAMRIGPDTGTNLDKLFRGPLFGSRHFHLHRRIWYNDPDVIFVGPRVALTHAQLLCSWIAVTGQLNISSDPYPDIPPDRLDLLKRTIPSHDLHARPIDIFETEPPKFWVVKNERRKPSQIIIGVFNWGKKPLKANIPLKWLDLSEHRTCTAFEFWTNRLITPIENHLQVNLMPAILENSDGKLSAPDEPCCAVFSLRELTDHPLIISTSRHITQGLIDVLSETWDARRNTLKGESLLVANDPYELRISICSTVGIWRFESCRVSHSDKLAGVKVTAVKFEPKLLRVRLVSPESRKVKWAIKFVRPGKVR